MKHKTDKEIIVDAAFDWYKEEYKGPAIIPEKHFSIIVQALYSKGFLKLPLNKGKCNVCSCDEPESETFPERRSYCKKCMCEIDPEQR